jgi:hypothetical protein
MRRPALILIAALAIAIPGSHARASEVRPDAPPASDPLDRRDWAAEIRRMRADERAELGGLARRARDASPGAAQAQAQRDLEEAKRQWRRRLLETQLTRMRAAGLAAQARLLEERLARHDAMARRAPDVPAGGAR